MEPINNHPRLNLKSGLLRAHIGPQPRGAKPVVPIQEGVSRLRWTFINHKGKLARLSMLF